MDQWGESGSYIKLHYKHQSSAWAVGSGALWSPDHEALCIRAVLCDTAGGSGLGLCSRPRGA